MCRECGNQMILKYWIHQNKKYIYISVIVFLVMFLMLINDTNFFSQLFRAITDSSFRAHFFLDLENPDAWSIKPTIWNFIVYFIQHEMFWGFDYGVIMPKSIFQVLIPIFSVVGAIDFYRYKNSLGKLDFYRQKKSKKHMYSKMSKYAIKVSVALFVSYIVYLIFVYMTALPGHTGSIQRSFLEDVLPTGFYNKHMFLYFVIEGWLQFFLIPYVYTMFAEACSFIVNDIKMVIASPLVYYYALAAFGSALYAFSPMLSIYFNPTVIMAPGSFTQYNSILMILINMIPLFLALIIMRVKYEKYEF